MVTWWSSPFDRLAGNTMSPSHFDRRDLVPIGYAAFAYALGVTAGTLIRRTLPAMAVTLVAFILARFGELFWLRPNFSTPLKLVMPLQAAGGPGVFGIFLQGPGPNDWIISEETINRAGQDIGANGGFGGNGNIGMSVANNGNLTLPNGQLCPNKVAPGLGQGIRSNASSSSMGRALQECLHKLDIRQVTTYQPSSRYWPFQIDETVFFVVLALLLCGFSAWWIRRKLA
jgi:hypothetical protein